MTLDNGNYGIVLVVLWVMQDLYHQPSTLNPIDPLKELLKGTLIDPFKGTPGTMSSLPQTSSREHQVDERSSEHVGVRVQYFSDQ